MRNPATSTVIHFPIPAARSFGRRPLKSFYGQLVCLVLVQHTQTKAGTLIRVSDNGDATRAVWLQRALLVIDPVERGRFLVATMSQQLATQKRLQVRFIDPSTLSAEQATQFAEASSLAARTRLRLRGFQQPLPFPGRNAWA